MEYGFLTTMIPQELEGEIHEKSRHNMQDAANALQWNLLRGLSQNLKKDISVFNVLPIGSFPQYYRDAFVKQGTFHTECGKSNINIGFCNVKLIRKYHQTQQIYRALHKWCGNDEKEKKTLFVYTVSPVFVKAIHRLKRNHANLTVCAIVADLPELSSLSSKQSGVQKWFIQNQSRAAYERLSCVDGFVLLTEHMREPLGVGERPFCIVEGIAPQLQTVQRTEKAEDGFTVLYTGTLHRRFGVLDLVEAMQYIQNEKCRLIICGIGDSETEIKAAAEHDSRIRYLGQVTRQRALELQRAADVLVNPRKNDEAFTKYSFPSKTMEYLASGVPLVAYKLDGIPDEYDAYIHYVREESPRGLAESILEVFELPVEVRREQAEVARRFVLEQKNCVVQTRKITEMISKMIGE